MTRTSYLRVYQPLEAFGAAERERWLHPASDPPLPPPVAAGWLLSARLPENSWADGAYLRDVNGSVYVCPWRTRLRMLVALLAFRGTVPEEVADAFVPEIEARRAAQELASFEDSDSTMRVHILHANWHVPLRWFVAFEGCERILTEDREGLRVRYEGRVGAARRRLAQALSALESSWAEDDLAPAIRELLSWLEGFHSDGVLELDYGSVARLFADDELVDDHSATEVWACLEGVSVGDSVRSIRVFAELTEKWAAARGRERIN